MVNCTQCYFGLKCEVLDLNNEWRDLNRQLTKMYRPTTMEEFDKNFSLPMHQLRDLQSERRANNLKNKLEFIRNKLTDIINN